MKDASLSPAAQELNSLMMDLQTAIKFCRLYPPEHPLLQKAIQKAHASLSRYLLQHGQLRLRVRLGDIHVDGKLINKDNETLQQFAHGIYSLGIGELSFASGADEREILKFLITIGLSSDAVAARGGIEAVWLEEGFAAIRINETLRHEIQKILTALPGQGADKATVLETQALSLVEYLGGDNDQLGAAGSELLSSLMSQPGHLAGVLTTAASHEKGGDLNLQKPATAADSQTMANCLLQPLSRILAVLQNNTVEAGEGKYGQLASTVRQFPEPVQTGLLAGLMRTPEAPSFPREFLGEFSFSELGSALGQRESEGASSSELHILVMDLPLSDGAKMELLACLELEPMAPQTSLLTSTVTAKGSPHLSSKDILAAQQQSLLDENQMEEISSFFEPELKAINDLLKGEEEGGAEDVFWNNSRQMLLLLKDERSLQPLVARLRERALAHLGRREFVQAVTSVRRIKEFTALNSIPPLIAGQLKQIYGELTARKICLELINHISESEKSDEAAAGLLEYLSMFSAEVMDDLLDWLEVEEQRWLRRAICQLLSEIGLQNLPVLYGRLSSKAWYTVRNVLSILGMINRKEILPHVAPLIRHPHPQVRREAIKTLGLAGDPRVYEWLAPALQDEEGTVRSAAIEWMGLLQERRAVPALLEIVHKRDFFLDWTDLKLSALASLAQIGDPEALPDLQRLAKRSWLAFGRRRAELALAAQNAWEEISKKSNPHE